MFFPFKPSNYSEKITNDSFLKEKKSMEEILRDKASLNKMVEMKARDEMIPNDSSFCFKTVSGLGKAFGGLVFCV